MHHDYYEALKSLAKCTFQCGSYDKRFCQDLARLGPYDMLSIRQEQNIERLTYHYRRQLSFHGYGAPVAFIEAAMQRARAAIAARTQEAKYHFVPEQRPATPEPKNPQLTLLEGE